MKLFITIGATLAGVVAAAAAIDQGATCTVTIVTESDFGTTEGTGDTITVNGKCQPTQTGPSGCFGGQGSVDVDVDGVTGGVHVDGGACPSDQTCCVALA